MTPYTTTIHYIILAGVIILLRHDIKTLAVSLRDGIVLTFKNGKDKPSDDHC